MFSYLRGWYWSTTSPEPPHSSFSHTHTHIYFLFVPQYPLLSQNISTIYSKYYDFILVTFFLYFFPTVAQILFLSLLFHDICDFFFPIPHICQTSPRNQLRPERNNTRGLWTLLSISLHTFSSHSSWNAANERQTSLIRDDAQTREQLLLNAEQIPAAS